MTKNNLESLDYTRILLKLSGEALLGNEPYGISPLVMDSLAVEIVRIHKLGIEIGLVIGGGNIFRGIAGSAQGMDRTAADQMGMLATVINSLALQDALKRHGVQVRVLSAIEIGRIAEPFIRGRALHHLKKGRIVIFAAGTGNPFFTTDTAAVLRALEINASILFKATRVDGVYDKDPELSFNAKRYNCLSYQEIFEKDIRVMDAAAISLARDAGLPIVVFNMQAPGNIERAVRGEDVGTLIGRII
jgi:uridylate kinase